jgi:hypothetical protein
MLPSDNGARGPRRRCCRLSLPRRASQPSAASIYHETDNRNAEGIALTNLRVTLRKARRSEEAITVLEQGLVVCRRSATGTARQCAEQPRPLPALPAAAQRSHNPHTRTPSPISGRLAISSANAFAATPARRAQARERTSTGAGIRPTTTRHHRARAAPDRVQNDISAPRPSLATAIVTHLPR